MLRTISSEEIGDTNSHRSTSCLPVILHPTGEGQCEKVYHNFYKKHDKNRPKVKIFIQLFVHILFHS